MNFDLYGFEAFPADVALEGEVDLNDIDIQGISLKDIITVRMTIQNVNEEYFCQAYMSVPVEEECCRCLTLFDDKLTGDFSFLVKIGSGESVLSSDTDNSDVIFLKAGEHVVDISGFVRETLILSLPTKPLCNQDCRGLCPSCGVNLNEESCKCKHAELDDRWEDLKDLSL